MDAFVVRVVGRLLYAWGIVCAAQVVLTPGDQVGVGMVGGALIGAGAVMSEWD